MHYFFNDINLIFNDCYHYWYMIFFFFCRMVSIQIVLDMNKMQLLPLPFLRNIQGTGQQVKLYNQSFNFIIAEKIKTESWLRKNVRDQKKKKIKNFCYIHDLTISVFVLEQDLLKTNVIHIYVSCSQKYKDYSTSIL